MKYQITLLIIIFIFAPSLVYIGTFYFYPLESLIETRELPQPFGTHSIEYNKSDHYSRLRVFETSGPPKHQYILNHVIGKTENPLNSFGIDLDYIYFFKSLYSNQNHIDTTKTIHFIDYSFKNEFIQILIELTKTQKIDIHIRMTSYPPEKDHVRQVDPNDDYLKKTSRLLNFHHLLADNGKFLYLHLNAFHHEEQKSDKMVNVIPVHIYPSDWKAIFLVTMRPGRFHVLFSTLSGCSFRFRKINFTIYENQIAKSKIFSRTDIDRLMQGCAIEKVHFFNLDDATPSPWDYDSGLIY